MKHVAKLSKSGRLLAEPAAEDTQQNGGQERKKNERGGHGIRQLSNEQISMMYSNIIQLCAQNVSLSIHIPFFLSVFVHCCV